jgi:hypothetical protein
MNITPCLRGMRLRDYLHGTWVEEKQVKSFVSTLTSCMGCNTVMKQGVGIQG